RRSRAAPRATLRAVHPHGPAHEVAFAFGVVGAQVEQAERPRGFDPAIVDDAAVVLAGSAVLVDATIVARIGVVVASIATAATSRSAAAAVVLEATAAAESTRAAVVFERSVAGIGARIQVVGTP